MFTTYKEASTAQMLSGCAPADPLATSMENARAQQDAYFRSLGGEAPPVAASLDLTIDGPGGGLRLRLVRPTLEGALPCIVFVRGAGWWAGDLDSHARTVHTLAGLSGFAVCVVDYSRTPEQAYPVQCNEVLAAVRWLRSHGGEHGVDGGSLVMFGESAGATLCLSAALRLRDLNAPPAGLVLFYPNAGGPKPTSRAYSQWVWRQYIGAADATAVPGPVPMLEDMRGLPPTWIGCGEDDPLMSDSVALAERLQQAGVPHSVTKYPGMPHAFLMFTRTLEPALQALNDGAKAARRCLAWPENTLPNHP
jgi:acetyl esterase